MISGSEIQYHVLEFTAANYPENYPYLNGSGIVPLLTFPILRAVWPGKPLPSGEVISRQYLGDQAVEDYGASVFNTIIGEWYMNFGPLGAFLGMVAIGIIIGALNERFMQNLENMTLLAAWLTLVPHWMTEWRGDLTSTTVMALAVVSIFLIFCWILGKLFGKKGSLALSEGYLPSVKDNLYAKREVLPSEYTY